MYITIEGPIGIGKTSLTNLISQELGYGIIHEIVEENPFLESFYLDKEKWGFQTELFFLASRYTQLKEINKKVQEQQKIVADYNIMKNIIFASHNLKKEEFSKFQEIFEILTFDLVTEKISIVLKGNLELLKKRIKMRARSFEVEIEDEYLMYLITAYDDYIELIKKKYPEKILVLEAEQYDFVNSEQDQKEVMGKIKKKIEEVSSGENSR